MKISSGYLFLLAFSSILIIGFNFNHKANLAGVSICFVLTVFFGLVVSKNIVKQLKDPLFNRLNEIWITKILFTIFLLEFGWIPQLDPLNSTSWGYDPQRYYESSWLLVQNNWDISVVELNYQGIIYFYASLFSIFGHSAYIPAFINSCLTLFSFRVLMLFYRESTLSIKPNDKLLIYLILIPEILWYDSITSRESLMSFLIILSIFPFLRSLQKFNSRGKYTSIFLLIISILAIATVRTSILIPVIGLIFILLIILKNKLSYFQKIFLGLILLLISSMMLAVQTSIGGVDFSITRTLTTLEKFENNVASEMEWQANSIGSLFIPNSFLENVLFSLPRFLLYLLAPLPNIYIPITGLFEGSYFAWQQFLVIITSFMNVFAFPFSVIALYKTWHSRKSNPNMLVLPFTFFFLFTAIVMGNFIIHERYRVMTTLLFYFSAFLGYSLCNRVQKIKILTFSIAVLTFLVLLYSILKNVL